MQTPNAKSLIYIVISTSCWYNVSVKRGYSYVPYNREIDVGCCFMNNIDNMSGDIRAEFNRYISLISQMDGVLRIYLFGSYANGNPTDSSDIDLMVIVRDGINALETMQNINYGLKNKRVPLDTLVDNVSVFDERSAPDRVTLQREIKNNGVLVYGQ